VAARNRLKEFIGMCNINLDQQEKIREMLSVLCKGKDDFTADTIYQQCQQIDSLKTLTAERIATEVSKAYSGIAPYGETFPIGYVVQRVRGKGVTFKIYHWSDYARRKNDELVEKYSRNLEKIHPGLEMNRSDVEESVERTLKTDARSRFIKGPPKVGRMTSDGSSTPKEILLDRLKNSEPSGRRFMGEGCVVEPKLSNERVYPKSMCEPKVVHAPTDDSPEKNITAKLLDFLPSRPVGGEFSIPKDLAFCFGIESMTWTGHETFVREGGLVKVYVCVSRSADDKSQGRQLVKTFADPCLLAQ
jgi:hypothetical protein